MSLNVYRFFILITVTCLVGSCHEARIDAEMIIHNAKIYTVNSSQPWAEAIAVRDGKIMAVGTEQEIFELQGPDTEMLDAQGHFIMPGFIEGHGHFPGLGNRLQEINFLGSQSWDEIVGAVAEKVKTAKPGEWIVGKGWHQEKWIESPQPNILGYPYHHALSEVSPANPVLLDHASGHAVIANKAAMEAAGVTIETANPRGGHIVRGDGNAAIGVFEENASEIIEDAYRNYLTTLSEEDIRLKWYEGIRLAQDECLRKGITSFQDAGSSLDEIQRLAELAERNELDVRIWMMIRHTSEYLDGKLDGFPKIGIGNGFFTSRALKGSIDGALGSYGAWLLEPYADKADYIGQNTTTIDELSRLADLSLAHGLQLCTHAIGDRANREALDLYEKKMNSKTLRWRIEHAQHLDPDDIPRFGNLGVIPSMQGIHCTSDAPFVAKRLGETRAREGAYVWKSLLESGAIVANGTDAPVEDIDPIACFYASVTRKRADTGLEFYPEQKLTRAEAIHSYTMANAYAAFEENEKGSLDPGKIADMVLLSNDLLSCTDLEILKTKVLVTIVNGEIKYRHSEFN